MTRAVDCHMVTGQPLPATALTPSSLLQARLTEIIKTQNELIAAGDELGPVLDLVALRTSALTGGMGAAVELAEGEELVYRSATGGIRSFLGTRVPVGSSLSGLCVRSGEVMRSDDTELDPRVNQALCRRLGIRSMIVVPLRLRNSTAGVLKVMSASVAAFDETDVATLQLMAGLITAAISRAADHAARQALIQEQQASVAALAALVQEREAAARALEDRNALISVFFDSTPLLIAVLEPEGSSDARLLEVSRAFALARGQTREALRGRRLSEFKIHPSVVQSMQGPFEETLRTRRPAKWDYTRPEPDGLRHLSGTITVLPGQEGEPTRFCCASEDITSHVQLRARAEVQERMAAIGRLAAGVAHEVNNPLSYAISNLAYVEETLLGRAGDLDEATWREVQQAVRETKEGAERVKAIVKDLYSFVRADSEVQETADLEAVARRAVLLTQNVVLPKAKLVQTSVGPVPVRGNGSQLGQVVINLLVNAAQAMPEGRPLAQNQITLRVGNSEDRSYVEVEDNGQGISPEVQARIFEPFFTTKPPGQGMGLGLSICHNIARNQGGQLTVESAAGRGARFRLSLPRQG